MRDDSISTPETNSERMASVFTSQNVEASCLLSCDSVRLGIGFLSHEEHIRGGNLYEDRIQWLGLSGT